MENPVILGGLAVRVQEGPVEGEIDFQNGEMLEVLCHAVHREDFLKQRSVPDHLVPAADPPFITLLRVDLPEPAGVAVAGRAYFYEGMEVVEVKLL